METHYQYKDKKAKIEIVGFQGQTASTTYFEIQTAPTTIYVKTNYQPTGSTDSGAVLIFQIWNFLPAGPLLKSYH